METERGPMWALRLTTGEWAIPLFCHHGNAEPCECLRDYIRALLLGPE